MEFTLTISGSDLLLLLPELWLTVLACIVLFVDLLYPRLPQAAIGYLSAAGIAVAAGIVGWLWAAGITGKLFNGMFLLDTFALFFKLTVLLSTLLILLLSIDYVPRIQAFRGEYYLMILLTVLGMLFMASANDLLTMFISLEFSTFGFYILVAYLREDPRSNEAGLKFFILGVFIAATLAFGISLIYGQTGTLLFTEVASMARTLGPTPGLVVGVLCLLIGLGFKIGAVPFHTWIPDTYQGAPTPITALLSIAPKAAAFAVILRVFFSTLGEFRGDWVWLVIALSIVSMTYGNIVAIAQRDIKRLLAYSGIAQIGNILIGMAAATRMGGDSILFYIFTYLFANVGAFAVVIAFSNLTNSDQIEDYSGLNRRSPLLAFAMLLFLLSLAGVPPLAGFIGKLYLFTAAINEGLVFLVVVGLINIIISMYYYLVVVKKIYINEPTDRSPIPVSLPLKSVVYVSMAGVLLLGIYPRPIIELAVSTTTIFAGLGQ